MGVVYGLCACYTHLMYKTRKHSLYFSCEYLSHKILPFHQESSLYVILHVLSPLVREWFSELTYRSASRIIQNNSSEAIIHTCTRFAKSLSIPTLASILSSTSPASIPLEWVPPPYYTLTPPPPQFWEQKPQWWPSWLDGTVAPRWMPAWISYDRAPSWWPEWMNNWITECMPYVALLYLVYWGASHARR